jgi:hypothetical protein
MCKCAGSIENDNAGHFEWLVVSLLSSKYQAIAVALGWLLVFFWAKANDKSPITMQLLLSDFEANELKKRPIFAND